MTEPVDRNDPLSHPFLAELLSDAPPKELNSLVQQRYRNAVTAALTLPEGEARQQVLNALNSGVLSAKRVRTLSAQVEDLEVVLKAEQPDKAQMMRAIEVIGLHIKSMQGKFKQAWDKEKEAGRSPDKGYWSWFDHELHAGTDAIRFSARGLLLPVPAPTPATDPNTPV